jgi:hypothetical protein
MVMFDAIEELQSHGQGHVKRTVRIALQYPGLKEFYLVHPATVLEIHGDVSPDKIKEMHAGAALEAMQEFFSHCFPVGQLLPEMLSWEFGNLVWIPEYDDWRRSR